MPARTEALPHTAPSTRVSLQLRWHRFRNRLIANPGFQRWAARTPIARMIANRRATQLHHITAGFVYSQTLMAFLDLELPQRLADGPVTSEQLVTLTGVPEPGLITLLKAARSLGLLEYYPDHLWGLGELGAALLANPGIAAMVSHHRHLYRDLAEPGALLSNRSDTALANYWAYGEVKSGTTDPGTYSDLMALSQGMIADYVLDTLDLRGHRQLLDIAGGTGSFATRAIARYPGLQARVFDLPAVAERARRENQLPEATLGFVGGDMFNDDLPASADLISLVRVLHDHDDGPVQALLIRAYEALPPGGRLIVAEPLAETPGSAAIGHGYFGMYLWAMGSGRPRTAAELTEMMSLAGFDNVREQKSAMSVLVRVLSGEKSKRNL